jgi:hypothetical protein
MALPLTPPGRLLLGVRTALGITTLLAPRHAARAFLLDPDRNPQLAVMGRMWGIRNLSLAAGMFGATGDDRTRWWRLQPAVDALDALAIAAEWRRGSVSAPVAALLLATALTVSALGVLAARVEIAQR